MSNKFKIISPSYNNVDWVEVNLASILNQTYDNYEVLYIDDCSTDGTYEKVVSIVGDDPRFTIIRNEENKGSAYNYLEYVDKIVTNDNDIIVHLDGDDWLSDEDVLEKLNNLYTEKDYWMTYGRFIWYAGPHDHKVEQLYGTPHDPFVHSNKLYRRDQFKASHLRTYRAFLFNKIDKKDLKSNIDGKYYWHALDVAWGCIAMEMCPKDKIGVPDFVTCVYNATPKNWERSQVRQAADNHKYEVEIRNRKHYKEGLSGDKLPQVNVFGDYKERNSIPKTFSYVYGLSDGEFDITLIQDMDIVRYVNGEIRINNKSKIVADIHEPPFLTNHSAVYDTVLNNHHLFDLILTYDERLLKLPNAVFRNAGYEVVLNKNVHTHQYPLLADPTLMALYPKSKIVSFITSNKTITEGHRFRVSCVNYLANNNQPIDLYGVGYNEISGKIEGLRDYAFSVAIENGIYSNWFTEKILDCFLTGTIPVYCGCTNIANYFNTKGIITFNTEVELSNILQTLSLDHYESMLPYVKENYNTAMKYAYDNDKLFEKYLKNLIP